MFTGIIAGTTSIIRVNALSHGKELRLSLADADKKLDLGASIALDGVCTTAIAITSTEFSVQLLPETLSKTTFKWAQAGDIVNWETSATPTTALGGHLVYGHVDDVGTIRHWSVADTFNTLTITYDPAFTKFLVPKGSICINGISLTVVDISASHFTCHIIPHTVGTTSLKALTPGGRVNLEYDIVAKYLYNFSTFSADGHDQKLLNTLKKAGLV